MRTETKALARALDVLAIEIQSADGVANAAIAEGAERLRELSSENWRLKTALADALSTFRDDDKTVMVSAERQEAWRAALEGKP